MIPGLEPIATRFRALDAPGLTDGYLDQLQSLTPVRGIVEAEHRGNVLAVAGSSARLSCAVTAAEPVQSSTVCTTQRTDLARGYSAN